MAKPDWDAIKSACQSGESVRSVAARFGVSHTAINNKAKKEGWEKVSSEVSTSKKVSTGKQNGNHRKPRSDKPPSKVSTKVKSGSTPDTKPERVRRNVVTNHPPFQPGNQHALKHGGYARRLLLKDDVIEDAKALTLEDELFRLRANNLVAAENIGRWITLLEDVDVEDEDERKALMDNIRAAENAMMRNTVRIESITGTLATVNKIFADTDYRVAATDKVSLEADRLRRDAGIDDGNGERDLNDFYTDIQTDAKSGTEELLDDAGT